MVTKPQDTTIRPIDGFKPRVSAEIAHLTLKTFKGNHGTGVLMALKIKSRLE